ncbi:hypothetical protein [Bifidobacterium moukalabense]|uniref:hypothetical protein n=1 Tax=Bifidobacterium moukalabense TaxID=1333651 RepID=UPI001FCEA4CD|nr:hypothetical protein [Bifidobacterium moukalabense]
MVDEDLLFFITESIKRNGIMQYSYGYVEFRRWSRVAFKWNDAEHVGFICTVNHHDFFGNELSYDIETIESNGVKMLNKNLTPDTVYAVPEGKRLTDALKEQSQREHGLRDVERMRCVELVIAESGDDDLLQRMLDAYKPGCEDTASASCFLRLRYRFTEALQRLDYAGMAEALADIRPWCYGTQSDDFENGASPMPLFDMVVDLLSETLKVGAWPSGKRQFAASRVTPDGESGFRNEAPLPNVTHHCHIAEIEGRERRDAFREAAGILRSRFLTLESLNDANEKEQPEL